jgi:hypothetical protein
MSRLLTVVITSGWRLDAVDDKHDFENIAALAVDNIPAHMDTML